MVIWVIGVISKIGRLIEVWRWKKSWELNKEIKPIEVKKMRKDKKVEGWNGWKVKGGKVRDRSIKVKLALSCQSGQKRSRKT